MVLKMAAPHTYTREDVTEIHTHGGILVTKRVLEAVSTGRDEQRRVQTQG